MKTINFNSEETVLLNDELAEMIPDGWLVSLVMHGPIKAREPVSSASGVQATDPDRAGGTLLPTGNPTIP